MNKVRCFLKSVFILSLLTVLTTCGSFGLQFEPEVHEDVADELVPSFEEEIPAVSEVPELYCPECGWVITEEAFYCSHCGIKLRDDGKEEPWHALTSIDELKGIWHDETGMTLQYPDYSLNTGFAMVSLETPAKDDTARWQQMALYSGYTMEQLWQKKNSWMAEIYGPVLSDENGTQVGRVCCRNESGEISVRTMIFIPEKIIRDNAAFFEISPDGTKLAMNGDFHFFSNLNWCLTGNGSVYERAEDTGYED